MPDVVHLECFRGKILITFPFKRKGLPSCSASLHVKAKNIRVRVLQISRPYLGFLSRP